MKRKDKKVIGIVDNLNNERVATKYEEDKPFVLEEKIERGEIINERLEG